MPDLPTDEAPPTFEASLEQLQRIVHDLEEGKLSLETSLARFEEGVRLLKSCHRILEQAEHRIEIVTGEDAAGNPITAPFDGTATFEGNTPAKPVRRRSSSKNQPSPGTAAPSEPDDREEGSLFG